MSKYTTFLKILYKVFDKFKYPQIWKINNANHIGVPNLEENIVINNRLMVQYLAKRVLLTNFGSIGLKRRIILTSVKFLNIHFKYFYLKLLQKYKMLDTPLLLLKKILRVLRSKRVLSKY